MVPDRSRPNVLPTYLWPKFLTPTVYFTRFPEILRLPAKSLSMIASPPWLEIFQALYHIYQILTKNYLNNPFRKIRPIEGWRKVK